MDESVRIKLIELQKKMLDGCNRCCGWRLPCSACQRNYKRDEKILIAKARGES